MSWSLLRLIEMIVYNLKNINYPLLLNQNLLLEFMVTVRWSESTLLRRVITRIEHKGHSLTTNLTLTTLTLRNKPYNNYKVCF